WLKGVVVHTPGREVSLVNPESKNELLFDDIIFEEDARKEHFGMLEIFKTGMPDDGQIIEITDLFRECLQNEDARTFLINLLAEWFHRENLDFIKNELMALSANDLLQFVIEGTTPKIPNFSLLPSPNLLFTRDLAAVAG